MKMDQTVCSETLANKIQKPGNYPEESIQLRQYTFRYIQSEVQIKHNGFISRNINSRDMRARLRVKYSDAIYATLVLIGTRQNEERLHTITNSHGRQVM